MKKSYLLLIAAAGLAFGCSKSDTESGSASQGTVQASSSSSSASEAPAEEGEAINSAVCVWDKAVVREAPEEKGKYITSVNLAEKVTLLNESKVDESGSKKREYLKVKLMDGKEGWMAKDFIAANAKAGVLVNNVEIYARPDLLAKTNKAFKRMDVVGVSECQNDWCKITGKRSGGSWIDQGWVKTGDLSYDEKDIAVAIYGKQALGQKPEKQVEELQKLIDNKDFQGSVFITDLRTEVDSRVVPEEIETEDVHIEEEELEVE